MRSRLICCYIQCVQNSPSVAVARHLDCASANVARGTAVVRFDGQSYHPHKLWFGNIEDRGKWQLLITMAWEHGGVVVDSAIFQPKTRGGSYSCVVAFSEPEDDVAEGCAGEVGRGPEISHLQIFIETIVVNIFVALCLLQLRRCCFETNTLNKNVVAVARPPLKSAGIGADALAVRGEVWP
jgi:hypothetical protein